MPQISLLLSLSLCLPITQQPLVLRFKTVIISYIDRILLRFIVSSQHIVTCEL